MSGVVLPFVIGSTIITGRALASKDRRMPRPYEYGSAVVIYGAAGLLAQIGDGKVGVAVAWGYTVALLLVPSASDLINLISGGVKAHGSPPQTVQKGANA